MRVVIDGAGRVAGRGTATVIAGDPTDQNTLADPTRVAPVTTTARGLGARFAYEFPASSVTAIRIGTSGGSRPREEAASAGAS